MTALPPESHTARRLEHATPEHLHLTTRRAFIGPIPEGWLKGHRKEWYRRYAHPKHDNSFNATTTPPEQTATAVEEDVAPRPSSQSANTGTATSTTSLLHDQNTSTASIAQSQPTDASRLQRAASKLPAVPKVHFSDSTKQQLRFRASRIASRGRLRNTKLVDGQVLKVDRMLVRVDVTRQTIGAEFDERVAQGVETQTADGWREYMVVCRAYNDENTKGVQALLQLYQTRVIAAKEVQKSEAKKKAKVQIVLNPRAVGVNLYSSLDKTLCMWTKTAEKGRTTIYYLRPQSGATSVEWYTFLRGALGQTRAQTLNVNVPDLNVSLRLDDPFRTLETSQLLADAAEGDDDALARAVNDEKGAAGAIVNRCIDMLKQSPEWNDILETRARQGRIGLAWRRYDRLEWVHGAVEAKMYGTIAMSRTHELELRPKTHYPISTRSKEQGELEEPAPIEGFLVRLTTREGGRIRMGKMLFKRLYFTTQNQFLLFLRPGRAAPPPPPKTQQSNGSVPTAKQIIERIPLIYDIDPYPLDGWLNRNTASASRQSQQKDDASAELESARNATNLLASDGFIDLCDVSRVRKMQRGAVPADEHLAPEGGSEVDFDINTRDDNATTDDGTTTAIDESRTFELLMTNGLVIRLQAYDQATRDEWISRLKKLTTYWRLRAKADLALFKSVRAQNLAVLGLDERAEALVGSFAYKWEVSASVASPSLYNLCGISQCRTVHLSGTLYRKPRRHTTFSRCHVILSHGTLLVYSDVVRTRSGARVEAVSHERLASVSLAGAYVYSGLLTEGELLYRNRTFDSNAPGHHALPRMWAHDNWTSTDEDAMTTFVIWQSGSKAWFRSSASVDDARDAEVGKNVQKDGKRAKAKTQLKRVSALGAKGRSVVLKARSRAERDQWVMALQVEIERLAGDEEREGEGVRIVEAN